MSRKCYTFVYIADWQIVKYSRILFLLVVTMICNYFQLKRHVQRSAVNTNVRPPSQAVLATVRMDGNSPRITERV